MKPKQCQNLTPGEKAICFDRYLNLKTFFNLKSIILAGKYRKNCFILKTEILSRPRVNCKDHWNERTEPKAERMKQALKRYYLNIWSILKLLS